MCDYNNTDFDFASGMAAFEAKHFSRAMPILSVFAERGDARAQHMVAIMHQNGLAGVVNEMAAYKWMKSSAEQGYDLAQHGLGFMYLEGECISKNPEKAAHWFQKASEQGLPGSMVTLATMYEAGNGVEQNQEKAIELYQQAGFTEMGT